MIYVASDAISPTNVWYTCIGKWSWIFFSGTGGFRSESEENTNVESESGLFLKYVRKERLISKKPLAPDF